MWGCSVPWGTQKQKISPTVLNTLHGTHDIPHMHHDTPMVLNIPHSIQDNPHGTHDIPHGTHDIPHSTEHPHGTQDIPHIYHDSPTVLKISPTVLIMSPTVLHTHSQGEYSAFQWFADKSKREKLFVSRGKSDPKNHETFVSTWYIYRWVLELCESLKPGSVFFPGVFPSFLYAGWQKSVDR